ncbi:PIF1-like helicase-domain-containing protein [Lyophyllum atratum]|nr:PIF1-like helicase-domain-containing protein [Lyophyllum atratum]
MPKGRKEKFYAVLHGIGGTRVYSRWEDYRKATHGFSGASSKGFFSYEDAENWLEKSCFPLAKRDEQNAQMIPTPPSSATTGSSSPRTRYPNSTRYWQDHRPGPNRIEVGVQTSSLPSSPVPVATLATYRRTVPPLQRSPSQEVSPNNAAVDPPPAIQRAPIQLSEEQRQVLELVKSGGTGKSVLLREIIRELKLTMEIAVTATTGIAGVNIGGSTVHSFAGIGLGKETAEKLAVKVDRSTFASARWRNLQVLIIDEISMMDGMFFDKLVCLQYLLRIPSISRWSRNISHVGSENVESHLVVSNWSSREISFSYRRSPSTAITI